MASERRTVTHNHQYAQPNANATESSTNRAAYSVNDPVTGMTVAISPRDCLWKLASFQNLCVHLHPHNKEHNNPNQRETDERPRRSTLAKGIPRAHQ